MAKTLIGIVSSNKPDKTIVVTVLTPKTHPLYRKAYSVTKKFMAHDEKNEAQVGDKVAIVESRPLSARKRYTLARIIEKPVIRDATYGVEPEVLSMTEKPEKVADKPKRKVVTKQDSPEDKGADA